MTDINDVVDRLIQAALDTLHHDTDDGDDVDQYEREVLRRKFTDILGYRDRGGVKAIR